MIGRRRRQGTVGVEFAICSTVFFFMINSIVDYGTLFADKHAINYGLVKAARYAAIHSASASVTSITAVFTNIIKPVLGSANVPNCSFSVSYPSGNAVGGTVVVSASYRWSSSIAHDVLPAITLSASQTLTIEH